MPHYCYECKYCIPCFDEETDTEECMVCDNKLITNKEQCVMLVSAVDDACDSFEKADREIYSG